MVRMVKLVRRTVVTATSLALAFALSASAATASAATKTHTATNNDTFWKLSRQYNVDLNKLMKANPTIDPLNIYAGLKIKIPATGAASANTVKAASASKAAQNTKTVKLNGKTIAYKTAIKAKATAYTASHEENGWGPVDYFGNPLKIGTVAVDPKVIPLGTKLYITGYDYNGLPQGGYYATATDTGSAINGYRVDLFVGGSRQQASQFGIQYINVYVLE